MTFPAALLRFALALPALTVACAAQPVAADLIITNGHVVTMNYRREVHENGAVIIQGPRIIAVGPAAIAARMTPWRCSVFSEARAEGIAVTIVDEHGSFLHAEYAGAREGTLLGAIAQFLESVRYRQNGSGGADPAAARPTEPPRFFRLGRAAGGEYGAQELPAPPGYRPGSFLEVQAIAEASDGEPLFTVYCDGAAFSQRELGEDFHARLGAYILGRRREAAAYPVYLTDLDLSALAPGGDTPLQTVHYLRHRQRLEAAINAALGRGDAIREGLAI